MLIWKLFSILILAVPAATFCLGLLCWRFPPQGPTWAFGYRSRRARASDASWLFAQSLAGKIWFCLGLVLVLVGLPFCGKLADLAVEAMTWKAVAFILVQDTLILLSMIPVELALVKRYDRFGQPRRKARDYREEDEDDEQPPYPVPAPEEDF